MVLEPISPDLLRARLRNGVVQFAFKKLDGTLRTAVGTTSLTSIPVDHHPKGVKESSPRQVCFFDLEKGSWRSVSVNQEIFLA